jgi:spore maturation protein CgeB
MVVVGSSVPDGCVVGSWACDVAPGRTAFYDIDTPITLGMIDEGRDEYISRALLRRYSLYLSFTGGPTLKRLEDEYGAACARALYGSVDPEIYRPHAIEAQWDLGYLGAYSDDRRRGLEHLMFEPARRVSFGRFIVAGAHYPEHLPFPANVEHVAHLPAAVHAAFYSAQRYTLNVTRGKMVACGWSPSGRLFEAAACGTPIISDPWPGLEEFFFPGREILVASSPEEVVRLLVELPEHRRESMAQAARARVFREHTAAHRAAALERYTHEVFERQAATRRATRPAVATALDAWPELRNASGGDAA